MLEQSLSPRPQSFDRFDGFCNLTGPGHCTLAGLGEGALRLLGQDFPDWSFRAVGGAPAAVWSADPSVALPAAESFEKPEAYRLQLAPGAVTITAGSPAGLWYAFATLDQLRRRHGSAVPCGTLRDAPAIARRGIHIDLKGYQPRFERLLEMVRILARFKVNTILLELEDKFAYASAPDVGIDGAYTANQLAELSRLCKDLFIELIPKIQCLGHVDYLLKRPRYAHLRELNHAFQYCPSHPNVLPLWSGMMRELVEAMPGHRYFHIGADETAHLGECPVCQKRDKGALYVEHVGRCIDAVRATGREPIMWEDILRNLHGHLSDESLKATWALGEKAVLMYWAYGYGGKDNTFPFLSQYRERGMRVWGASGYSGCGPGWYQNLPPLRERAANIDAWTKSAVEDKLEGVMCTSWTRIVSFYPPTEIPEACWPHMLYAAESMWSGRPRPLEDFVRAVGRLLFGDELPEIMRYLFDLNVADYPKGALERPVPANAERYALLRAAIETFDHEQMRQHSWMSMIEILHAHHGLLGDCAPDYALKHFRARHKSFADSLQKRREMLRAALADFYLPSTIEDVLRSRFGRDERLVAELGELIERTREQ